MNLADPLIPPPKAEGWKMPTNPNLERMAPKSLGGRALVKISASRFADDTGNNLIDPSQVFS